MKFSMKPLPVGAGLTVITALLLGSCSFAQEKTTRWVALRAMDTHYVSTVAKGGLSVSGKEITNRETFVLTDLNGGALADGDTIYLSWEPTGTRPTYWHESPANVDRVGTKPDDACTFKVKLQQKVAQDAPPSMVLQTASGKFVAVSGKSAALTPTDAQDKAVALEIVDVPQADGTGKAAGDTVPATAVPATAVPATAAPATVPVAPAKVVPPPAGATIAGAIAPLPTPADGQKPTLFLIGDSTVNNGTKGLMGWGTAIKNLFDPAKITVENRARGGRSSRTFLTEGLWDAVLKNIKPGDFVLMQFGHNDGGKPEGVYPNGRASLGGNSEETREVETKPGTKEVVHTYGWYLRRYITDAKAKGATPIVLSMVPRNDWKEGHVARAATNYGGWAKAAAGQEGALFVDLNEIVAAHYEALGQEKVKGFFPFEHTHTSPEGAHLNAQSVVEGLKALPGAPFDAFLSAEGVAIAAAPPVQTAKP